MQDDIVQHFAPPLTKYQMVERVNILISTLIFNIIQASGEKSGQPKTQLPLKASNFTYPITWTCEHILDKSKRFIIANGTIRTEHCK